MKKLGKTFRAGMCMIVEIIANYFACWQKAQNCVQEAD